jgi:hypothetical protein
MPVKTIIDMLLISIMTVSTKTTNQILRWISKIQGNQLKLAKNLKEVKGIFKVPSTQGQNTEKVPPVTI